MLAALRDAATDYDVVLLDLGAGLDRAVRHMSAFADTLLVVVTEEPTSLTDAYAVLKLHHADRPGGDAGVVVNQAASRATGERTHATLARVCLTFLGGRGRCLA
jgi:flagellar biosynthesis protein FlhG